MGRRTTAAMVAMVGAITACGGAGSSPWFGRGFDAALAEARASDRLVMVEFYTDWCTWCRRLEQDTLTDTQVREELAKVIPIRVDAEGRGRDLAVKFGVDRYPTVVFVDADGHEVDRIMGYLPPERFAVELHRIRAGDTFFACLQKLTDDPTDVDAIRRSVAGYLERSDPEGAIARIRAFHDATGNHAHELCNALMFHAKAELVDRVYARVGRLWQDHATESVELPTADVVPNLRAALSGLATETADDQAASLRASRRADASTLLDSLQLQALDATDLLIAARFAFDNGSVQRGADLVQRWADAAGDQASPEDLDRAARWLYLAREDLELATDLARHAWQARPDARSADTLSRVLYAAGDLDGALRLQDEALARAGEATADGYRRAARQMRSGEPLDERLPFDAWPGTPGVSL